MMWWTGACSNSHLPVCRFLKKKSSGPTIGSKRSLQLFFMACCDLDRFRAFVASEGFADVYDVPAGEREAGKRQARDADLMDTAPDE